MGCMNKGSAANAKLNGEFSAHVNRYKKRHTAKIRRQQAKRILKEQA